jgi:hypothetical protein
MEDAGVSDLEVSLGSVDEQGNGGDQGISVGHVAGKLQVTKVQELYGDQRAHVPPPLMAPDGRGQVLGGVEFVVYPSIWWEEHDNPQAMISAAATLTLDGGSPLELPTRFIPGNVNFDQVAVSVPDVAGPGSLTLELVWADPCYRYEASRTFPVDVVSRSVTAGCVLDRDGHFDQLRDVLDETIHIGSLTPRAFSPVNEARYLPFGNPGIDAFILYAFDPEAPEAAVEPGAALRLESRSDDVRLGDDLTLSVWTRASVAKAIKDYPPEGAKLVLSRTPEPQPDGSFRLRVPSEPGRYVAGVSVGYESTCSSGDLWTMVNIEVVAPAGS